MQYTTSNPNETKKIAADLAADYLHTGGVITLSGELGAGKTTFTQGFAAALGITDKILSPTFILTRQYQIPNSDKTLYHIDLYRLENSAQIEALGLKEIIGNNNNIILIEWPERLNSPLESNNLKQIKIKLGENPDQRLIEIS